MGHRSCLRTACCDAPVPHQRGVQQHHEWPLYSSSSPPSRPVRLPPGSLPLLYTFSCSEISNDEAAWLIACWSYAVSGVDAASGGNCQNVCESGITHFEPCVVEHNCRADNTTCSADCQECIDDVYSECGGCSQLVGDYNWDTDSTGAPAYKSDAESKCWLRSSLLPPATFSTDHAGGAGKGWKVRFAVYPSCQLY